MLLQSSFTYTVGNCSHCQVCWKLNYCFTIWKLWWVFQSFNTALQTWCNSISWMVMYSKQKGSLQWHWQYMAKSLFCIGSCFWWKFLHTLQKLSRKLNTLIENGTSLDISNQLKKCFLYLTFCFFFWEKQSISLTGCITIRMPYTCLEIILMFFALLLTFKKTLIFLWNLSHNQCIGTMILVQYTQE